MEQINPYEKLISVCVNEREPGSCCAARGSVEIVEELKSWVKKHGLKDRVRVARSGCFGLCETGPNIAIYPDGGPGGTWYQHVTQADVPEIIQKHIAPLLNK